MKDWLRGRDLNPRSRSRGIMSRHGALSQSTEKIRFHPSVVSTSFPAFEHLPMIISYFSTRMPRDRALWSNVTRPHCVARYGGEHLH
jgi:hypothetical protein